MSIGYNRIEDLPKEKLLELCQNFAKNWLAHDGLWFQSIEAKRGMEEAMEHDENAWRRFTVIEARRVKQLLELPEQAGIVGLARALRFRMYALLNEDEIEIEGNTLTYKVKTCRVQNARERKGMEFHPCKSVGIPEYTYFAQTIDDRFRTEAVSCYPDLTEPEYKCVWKFTLEE
ncbi:DUF6125 family protein [Christensenellaceae bacterium OttesenSCG-928-K19]|nr:DUF6125 family protein [Christensenellaceae bacterium OttesenSCG-928-K19]